ncbi:MAG: tetratricopeptide repeat protein [Candidatus Thermoplasmatota archaeon]|nr:tetratricopeptide repeat protein [Candidatus Thermoplasmatota archaeon]
MAKIKELHIHSHTVAFALIVLITFGIYYYSLYGEFVWDDKDLILNHSGYLNDWKNIFSVFTKPFFGKSPTYRPLLIVSFIIDYQMWGLQPFGFHYTNVLLHVANALLVYLLVFMLLRHASLALFASLIFATHPIQTEAVAWISGRNDVMVTLFSLLTLIFYIRWRSLKGAGRVFLFIGFLLAFGCVLLSKESGIVLLLLMVLVDSCFQHSAPYRIGSRRKAYLSLLLVSFLYIYLRMKILGGIGLGYSGDDFIRRFSEPFIIYAYYFKILFFPVHQTANPFIPYVTSIKDPAFISSFLLVSLLILTSAVCWRRIREISFVILWIFIALLPVSGIVPLTVPALEHRLYLGVVSFGMLMPLLFYKMMSLKHDETFFKRSESIVISLILIVMVSIYGIKTVTRNTIWKGETHFWLKTVEESPFSVFARINLGNTYFEKKEYDKAIEEFNRALSLNPNASKAYSNLGRLYCVKGDYQRSLHYYEEALQLRPYSSTSYSDLGFFFYHLLNEHLSMCGFPNAKQNNELNAMIHTYGVEGLYQNSLYHYKKALQLNFDRAEVHNNLGDLFYLKKSYQLAAEEYQLAIQINPYYVEAFNNLGLVHFDEKRYEEAQQAFVKALALKPDFAEAYNNLGMVYLKKELYDKALDCFNQAFAFLPDHAEVNFNLALVYLRGFSNKQKGIYYLKRSLEFDPHPYRAAMIRELLAQLD